MKNTKELTLAGMMIALMTVIAFVPQLGYIQLTPVIGVTTMHIPVIIGAVLLGRKFGFILGTTFGILSLLVTLQRGATPFELFFLNPLISILPRVLFGMAVYEVYAFVSKFIKKDEVVYPVTALVTTLIHSLLVLGAIGLIYGAQLNEWGIPNIMTWIYSILVSNAIFEALFAAVIVTIVAIPLKKLVK
jgi:uncharacterized membrane protein